MTTTINDFAFDYEQFDFAHLRAVVPVARTATLGDVTLTVMSLELYEAGFAAILLFEQMTEPPFPDRPDADGPILFRGMPALSTHDDLGARYEGRPRAGYGGGGQTVSQMHQVYNFAPALNPAARTLTLDISFVTRLGWNQAGEPQWTADDVLAGPWSASITLPEVT
jgi:hypothetical protein